LPDWFRFPHFSVFFHETTFFFLRFLPFCPENAGCINLGLFPFVRQLCNVLRLASVSLLLRHAPTLSGSIRAAVFFSQAYRIYAFVLPLPPLMSRNCFALVMKLFLFFLFFEGQGVRHDSRWVRGSFYGLPPRSPAVKSFLTPSFIPPFLCERAGPSLERGFPPLRPRGPPSPKFCKCQHQQEDARIHSPFFRNCAYLLWRVCLFEPPLTTPYSKLSLPPCVSLTFYSRPCCQLFLAYLAAPAFSFTASSSAFL